MQNRSKYGLQFVPVEFSGGFPLYVHDHLRHPSREISVLHRHDCMELGFCVEGKGVFAVEGKIMDFRSGDFTVIGPSEAHLAASAPGTTSHWYWFYLDFERLLRPAFLETDLRFLGSLRGAAFRNVFNGTAYPWGPLILKQLFCAETKEEKIALLLLFSARLREISGAFAEMVPAEEKSGFERIAKAVNYFGLHYPERISVAEAARLCGMSIANFRRVFQQETGVAPLDYLNRLRICMAKAELRTGRWRIFEVAARCGFPSLSSFNRQFRKHEKRTPREVMTRKE